MAARKAPGSARKKNQKAASSPEMNAIKNFGTLAAGMAGFNLPTNDIVIVHPKSGPKARFWSKDEVDDLHAKAAVADEKFNSANDEWLDDFERQKSRIISEKGKYTHKDWKKLEKEWQPQHIKRMQDALDERHGLVGDSPFPHSYNPETDWPTEEGLKYGSKSAPSPKLKSQTAQSTTPKVPKSAPKTPETPSTPAPEPYALEDSALPHRFGFMRHLPVALGILGAGQTIGEYVKEKRSQKKLPSKSPNK